MSLVRVLNVVGVMNRGGMESRTMDIYRNIDRSKVQFDFLVHTTEKSHFDDEIVSLGGKIIPVCRKADSMLKNIVQTTRAMRGYSIVHIHSSYAIAAVDAMCALFAGAKIRIVHSRNSFNQMNKKKHDLLKPFIPLFANRFFAVSKTSGVWMFKQKNINGRNYKNMNNSINAKLFRYNPATRERLRKELSIGSAFAIGFIGRLTTQKNHSFFIEVFKRIIEKLPNAKLLLVGDGELREDIENNVKQSGLEGKVILLGVRDDIPDLMQAMDALVLPSLFEGLPGVAVEAQAAGLKTFLSDTITTEVNIVKDLVEFLPIDKGADIWADRLGEFAGSDFNRRDTYNEIVAAGFDIETVAKWYEDFYLSGGKM